MLTLGFLPGLFKEDENDEEPKLVGTAVAVEAMFLYCLSYSCDWCKEEGILSFGALPCSDARAVLFAFGSKKQGVV